MDKVYRSLQDFDSIGNRADTRLAKGSDVFGHGLSANSPVFALPLVGFRSAVARGYGDGD